MNKTIDKADAIFIALCKEAASWRQTLHMNPQTCYEETFASGFISEKLKELNIEHHVGLAKTGVVATINGKGSANKAIALRADIDALNITEENDFSYKSKNQGKMHACGHDGHTAMLLGTAKYLKENNNFNGKVYLIFQPAEEGGAGGDKMIKEGLFEKFPTDSVWGLHNMPGFETGEIQVMSGAMMASSDVFKLTVRGKGGHAAMPHTTVDPVFIASNIVVSAQSLVSRNINPTDPAVISFTMINGGSANNIIPDKVEIIGTFRTLNDKVRAYIMDKLPKITNAIANSFGGEVIYELWRDYYPPLVNTENETKTAAEVAKESGANFKKLSAPIMGAEDFAFMLQKKPGCYIALGNGMKCANLHTSKYDFNDEAIPYGISYWVTLVNKVLS